jgi:hypothetical protein
MYSDRPGLILGFHGCDENVRNDVVLSKTNLKSSSNDHDWLGWGMYFWANSPERALGFASQPRLKSKIKTPSVLGAVIDLKKCLDLLEYKNLTIVKNTYDHLSKIMKSANLELPKNVAPPGENESLLRKLDCFVIESLHKLNTKDQQYDSVMSVFLEGKELYDNAGFREKNHIQICIRNPDCIKGYFIPRSKS